MSEDRFDLEECIGTGGFGVVYRARMTTSAGLVRMVALKLLRSDVASAGAVARLRDEARLLAALRHRAILSVHDLVMFDGRVALVSEYIEGADLAEIVSSPADSLPPRVALEIVGEVAGALSSAWTAAHPVTGRAMNLIHRDIKPANIRISTEGAVKLLDFGIAKSDNVARDAMTGTGMLVGTVGYLAPDRFTEESVQPSSDVYALGIVLYEAVTGRRLFGESGRRDLMRMAVNHLEHEAFVAKALGGLSDVDSEFQKLLTDMLEFEPTDRPTSLEVESRAEELADHLPGMRLGKWARERTWAKPVGLEDPRVGSTLTWSGMFAGAVLDSTVEALAARGLPGGTPTGAVSTPSRSQPAWRGPVQAIGAALAIAVAGGALFFAFDSGDGASGPLQGPTETSRMAPVEGGASPPVPTSSPSPDGSSVPASRPGASVPEASAAPLTSPAQPAPTPTPAPSPPPAPSPTPSPTPAAAAAPPPAAPSPESSDLEVTFSSLPLGASVKLFGREVCTTPCTAVVPEGRFIAKFHLPDGREGEEVIDVDREHTQFGHGFAPQ